MKIKIRCILFVVGFVLADGAATYFFNAPKNPYSFVYEDGGVRYYSYCVGESCTIVAESEVPEELR